MMTESLLPSFERLSDSLKLNFGGLVKAFEEYLAREGAPRYYYLRTLGDRKPLVTVCELWGEGELMARGVAFCSLSDAPCKRRGRQIALGRAKKALRWRYHIAPINHAGKAFDIIRRMPEADRLYLGALSYKGEYLYEQTS